MNLRDAETTEYYEVSVCWLLKTGTVHGLDLLAGLCFVRMCVCICHPQLRIGNFFHGSLFATLHEFHRCLMSYIIFRKLRILTY